MYVSPEEKERRRIRLSHGIDDARKLAAEHRMAVARVVEALRSGRLDDGRAARLQALDGAAHELAEALGCDALAAMLAAELEGSGG